MEIQVLEFLETPGDQYQIGVCSVLYGPIILRFRISPAKEGGGYYILEPSLNAGLGSDGKKAYLKGFEIDSRSQSMLLTKAVREYVDARLGTATRQNSYASASQGDDFSAPF